MLLLCQLKLPLLPLLPLWGCAGELGLSQPGSPGCVVVFSHQLYDPCESINTTWERGVQAKWFPVTSIVLDLAATLFTPETPNGFTGLKHFTQPSIGGGKSHPSIPSIHPHTAQSVLSIRCLVAMVSIMLPACSGLKDKELMMMKATSPGD
ncbi:unnamed protein product [Pleuronectes platessa]|uniref:Uncharacterized protein n=1 Tax=Pleuronectes platessa TaxID=8262 RepID=A0A9N7YJY9_PLEPL|nr:unnamed protein product [Pleuronectes platessa]